MDIKEFITALNDFLEEMEKEYAEDEKENEN